MIYEANQQNDSASAQPNFSALRHAWQDFATFFGKTNCVPNNAAAFSEKFGAFSDAQGVLDFVTYASRANQIATALGSVESLREQLASNPALLQSETAPKELYAQVVWCASRVRNAASSFESTLASLVHLFHDASADVDERAEQVKQVLTGTLVPEAVALKAFTLHFKQQISPLQSQLQEINEGLNKSNLFNLANQEIGYLESKLPALSAQLEAAKKEAESAWIDKEKKQKHYQELQSQANAIAAQLAAKRLFVSQLDNLFLAASSASVAALIVSEQLDKVGKIFADARSFLMSLCTAASAAQLADYQWLSKALDLPKALAFWVALASEAQNFTQSALQSGQ